MARTRNLIAMASRTHPIRARTGCSVEVCLNSGATVSLVVMFFSMSGEDAEPATGLLRVEDMIRGRVGAGGKTAGRAIAEELGNVEGHGRRIDDVAFLGDQRTVDPFHDPLQLASQHDPELGKVCVHVAPVSGGALGIVLLAPVDEIATDPVLALCRLAPGAL